MYCRITREPLDGAELLRRARANRDGALILFMGVVRDHDAGRAVAGIRYEAYEDMARGKLEAICSEVAERFEVSEIAVVHRIGELGVGEASVAIAVAAPHRDAAYRASREVIERIKVEVPIWKRERFSDGEEEWVEGRVPPASDRTDP